VPDLAECTATDAKALYLDLMKQCLTYMIYDGDSYERLRRPQQGFLKRRAFDVIQAVNRLLGRRGIKLVRQRRFEPALRLEGRDWPPLAHTMIGLKRLDNLQFCVEDALANQVQGNLIETGVWRGGAAIFMRAILKAYGVTDRIVCVADSFEGLPAPNTEKYPHDVGSEWHTYEVLAVSLEEVKSNFARYGLLDDQVRFVKGWFRDTLPGLQDERWAVIRLDGDLYESTMDALTNLYPNLSVGGYVVIDDFGAIQGCRQAVEDYRSAHRIREEMHPIDWSGVFWQRVERQP